MMIICEETENIDWIYYNWRLSLCQFGDKRYFHLGLDYNIDYFLL